jgi:hypothetical protein
VALLAALLYSPPPPPPARRLDVRLIRAGVLLISSGITVLMFIRAWPRFIGP